MLANHSVFPQTLTSVKENKRLEVFELRYLEVSRNLSQVSSFSTNELWISANTNRNIGFVHHFLIVNAVSDCQNYFFWLVLSQQVDDISFLARSKPAANKDVSNQG